MPTGPKGEKRPADVIGNAVRVAQIATGEADTRESRIVRERIKESWEALKREWIGKGAIAGWSAAMLAEKLGPIAAPKAERTAVRH